MIAQDTRRDAGVPQARPAAPTGGPFAGGIGWIDRTGIYRVSSAQLDDPRPERRRPLLLQDRDGDGRAVRERGHRGARHEPAGSSSWPCPTHDARGPHHGRARRRAARQRASTSAAARDELGFSGLVGARSPGPRGARRLRAAAQRRALAAAAASARSACSPSVARARRRRRPPRRLCDRVDCPGWTIVIDRPRSDIFAAARRAPPARARADRRGRGRRLLPDRLAAPARAPRGRSPERTRAPARRPLARARRRIDRGRRLGGPRRRRSRPPTPTRSSVVALEAEDRLGLELAAVGGSALSDSARARSRHGAPDDASPTSPARRSRSRPRRSCASSTPRSTPPAAAPCARSTARRCARPAARAIGALCLLFGDERRARRERARARRLVRRGGGRRRSTAHAATSTSTPSR